MITGTQDVILSSFKVTVFPNPFSHHTTIEVRSSAQEKIQIRILSTLGKELVAPKEYHTNELIELGESLGEGLLLLEIKSGKSVSTVKLIKN